MAKKKRQGKSTAAKKPEALQHIYANYRREFTAADLQKYTEIEEGIPAEQVLSEMEAIQRRYEKRKKV